ncbi:MAG: response regulator transcription factor [Vampirovibrionia bacterium]
MTDSKKNILLIEDDNKISTALKCALEARNYDVTIISDGLEALNQLDNMDKNLYDLVLLDLMLPGANGWEILIKIRSLKNTENWPVIMLTAIDDEASESKALFDGANDYISKPFSMKILLARIDANIKKKNNNESLIDFDLHFSDGDFQPLSSREKEILSYVTKGYSNKEMTEILFISENTIGNHISNIFQKLKVSNRTQAAIVALKYSLI